MRGGMVARCVYQLLAADFGEAGPPFRPMPGDGCAVRCDAIVLLLSSAACRATFIRPADSAYSYFSLIRPGLADCPVAW